MSNVVITPGEPADWLPILPRPTGANARGRLNWSSVRTARLTERGAAMLGLPLRFSLISA